VYRQNSIRNTARVSQWSKYPRSIDRIEHVLPMLCYQLVNSTYRSILLTQPTLHISDAFSYHTPA